MAEINTDRLFPWSQLYITPLYVNNIDLYFKDWVKEVDLFLIGK
jgi:hypothetical protein